MKLSDYDIDALDILINPNGERRIVCRLTESGYWQGYRAGRTEQEVFFSPRYRLQTARSHGGRGRTRRQARSDNPERKGGHTMNWHDLRDRYPEATHYLSGLSNILPVAALGTEHNPPCYALYKQQENGDLVKIWDVREGAWIHAPEWMTFVALGFFDVYGSDRIHSPYATHPGGCLRWEYRQTRSDSGEYFITHIRAHTLPTPEEFIALLTKEAP